MYKFKKLTAVLAALVLTVSALPFAASAATSGDWTYSVSGSNATITKYSGKSASVSIPSKIGNYTVTAIGSKAFDNCDKMTSVKFPSTVTTIAEYAFYDCDNIKTLSIGTGVKTIGTYAFEYCVGMTEVSIPASVTSIGHGAFSDCYALKNINVNSGNAYFKSVNGALFNKNGDTIYAFPAGLSGNYVIPSTVKTIFHDAFSGSGKLTSVSIPSSVTTIGDYAFWDCKLLTLVSIPDSVTKIGASSFERCAKLRKVNFGTGLTEIGGNAFAYCTALTTASLPNKLVTLGKQAFLNCSAITEVYIPKSTTSLASGIFSGASKVTAYVFSGSAAETYCKNNSVKYSLISTKTSLNRLGGASRYDTAVSIVKAGWTSAQTVILANGAEFADSLAGVTLSKALDAPILLTSSTSLDTAVLNQIKSLGAKKVIILGGTVSVSDSVKNQITKAGYTVERVYGASRFETAVKVAEKTGKAPQRIFIVDAYNYPDALAVSPAAGISGSPILYINKNGVLDSVTAAYIKKYPSVPVTILGGNVAISTNAEKNIKALGVKTVERIAGSNRYETAVLINKKFNSLYTGADIAFTTGELFPDALAGGAFAAKNKIPVVLVSSGNKDTGIADYVKTRAPKKAYIFGGQSAVSDLDVYKYI